MGRERGPSVAVDSSVTRAQNCVEGKSTQVTREEFTRQGQTDSSMHCCVSFPMLITPIPGARSHAFSTSSRSPSAPPGDNPIPVVGFETHRFCLHLLRDWCCSTVQRGLSPSVRLSVRLSVLWLVVRLHTPRFVCFQNFRCHEILTLSMSCRLSISMALWVNGGALRYGAVRKFVATIGSCCEQIASIRR